PIWPVSDGVAPEISERFHTYFSQGVAPNRALNQALKNFLDDPSRRRKDREPCVWGQFGLYGFSRQAFGLR
ncbi:MAG: CHAT domain-containing protein, partial [Roseibium sp.]